MWHFIYFLWSGKKALQHVITGKHEKTYATKIVTRKLVNSQEEKHTPTIRGPTVFGLSLLKSQHCSGGHLELKHRKKH